MNLANNEPPKPTQAKETINGSPIKSIEETNTIAEEIKEEEPIAKEEKLTANSKEDKPKINVDADSIIVNDNVITDDEFFDDFFS